MQRKKLTGVAIEAFDTWKAETKKTKQVKKVYATHHTGVLLYLAHLTGG